MGAAAAFDVHTEWKQHTSKNKKSTTWALEIGALCFKFFFFFFEEVFIYLEGRVRQRDIFCLLVHFPNGRNWARTKLDLEVHLGLLCEWQSLKQSTHLQLLFAGTLASNWSAAVGTQTDTHMECLCRRQQLNLLCHRASPMYFSFIHRDKEHSVLICKIKK